MLSQDEKEKIEQEILSENKKVMKEILVMAEFCVPTDKFESFRHKIFDQFGLSGLETRTKKILDKYTETKE